MTTNGKLVVLTGVTKGLGRAMVGRFAESGWTVVGCGRSADEIAQIRQSFPSPHDFHTMDIADSVAVEGWAERVLSTIGVPDLLINNASVVNHNAPLWEITAEEMAYVFNINVQGAVHLIRAFVPAMIQRKQGVIVNISSSWGRYGEALLAPYCASKFAIEGLTQSLAKELPEGMAAVAVDPGGSIDTSMLRFCAPEYVAQSPTPEEWARVSVPFFIGLTVNDNGKSLTCPPVSRHG